MPVASASFYRKVCLSTKGDTSFFPLPITARPRAVAASPCSGGPWRCAGLVLAVCGRCSPHQTMLQQRNELALGFRIPFNIALGHRQTGMAGELLHVPETPPDLRDFPCGAGNERSATGM